MSRKRLEMVGRERLRKIVEQTNLTVTALAQRCNVTRSGFNVWLLNGKLPIEQLEKILVIAAFNDAEIDDKPQPIHLGDKDFIPDFIVTPSGASRPLTVEVKPNGINLLQVDMLKNVGVDAVVFLEGDQVNKVMLEKKSASTDENRQAPAKAIGSDLSKKSELATLQGAVANAKYSYLLRPTSGQMVNLELPVDLSDREAERLALYIKSLVATETPHSQKVISKSKRSGRGKK